MSTTATPLFKLTKPRAMLLSSTLREHRDKKNFVTIERASIDKQDLHGFIVDFSGPLLLIHSVRDSKLEGLRVIRRADVTRLECTEVNQVQREIMLDAGLVDKINFSYRPPLSSLRHFLRSRSVNEIVVLEDELTSPKDSYIGALMTSDQENVYVRSISPSGKLADRAVAIPLTRVTSCQLNANHVKFYAQHFGQIQSQSNRQAAG